MLEWLRKAPRLAFYNSPEFEVLRKHEIEQVIDSNFHGAFIISFTAKNKLASRTKL